MSEHIHKFACVACANEKNQPYKKLLDFVKRFAQEEDSYNYWHAYQNEAGELLKELKPG